MNKYIYLAVLESEKGLDVIAKEIESFSLLKYYKTLEVLKFSLDHQISESEIRLFKNVELEQMFHVIEEE